MSEPVSAFAAYNSGKAQQKKNAAKKTNAKKSTSQHKPASASSKRSAAKSQKAKPKAISTLAKSKTKSTTATANGGAKAKPGNKPQVTKKTNTAKAVPAKKRDTAKAAAKPAAKRQTASKTVTNGKASASKIKESEIDTLVEQLLGDSPTNPKQLTKAQQKKKQDLEDYLVQQLELDDDQASGSEEDSFDSAGEEEEDDEFTSGEYTINSYPSSEEEEEGEEEETQVDTSCSSESESDSAEEREDTKKSKTAAGKRKSDAASLNGPSEAKQAKQVAEQLPKTAAGRKSLNTQKASSSKETNAVTVKRVSAPPPPVKRESLPLSIDAAKMNSIKEGEKSLMSLLEPLALSEFLENYWEKNVVLVNRKSANLYQSLISFEEIDQVLLKNHIEFTRNIDITSYKNGKRQTLNPEGRALPPVVWDHYGQGCSIRFLNPQTYFPGIYALCSSLQEYFHCMVGANFYLTPPNSQGFAPHYDDIEAFVLQIEGRKRWRLYKPRTTAEVLPRESSRNFNQGEIGKPYLEEVLTPGAMLYFPRGTIHQATTEPGYHSLHITISVYQKQSYADLMEHFMPLMLQRAIASNVHLRKGVPFHLWQHAGIAFSNVDTKERCELKQHVTKLIEKCLRSVPLEDVLDAAVDQMAKKYQREALPPRVLNPERVRTIFGSRSVTNERGECVCDYEIDLRTNVRLLRAHIMRLVKEEGKLRIYYYLDNSKVYCEYEPNFIEIECDEGASIEVLIRSYPKYVSVSQLPLKDEERKVQMVTALWERGLLMMEKPFV